MEERDRPSPDAAPNGQGDARPPFPQPPPPAPPVPPVPPISIPSFFDVLLAQIYEAYPNGILQPSDSVPICLQVVEPLLQQARRPTAQQDHKRWAMAVAAFLIHTAAHPDEAIRLLTELIHICSFFASGRGEVAVSLKNAMDARVAQTALNFFVHLVAPYPFNYSMPVPHGAEHHRWNGAMLMNAARIFIQFQCQSLPADEWFASSAVQFSPGIGHITPDHVTSTSVYWQYIEDLFRQFSAAAQHPEEAPRSAEWCMRNASYEIGQACELVRRGDAAQNIQLALLRSESAQMSSLPPSQNVECHQLNPTNPTEGPPVQDFPTSSLTNPLIHLEEAPNAQPIAQVEDEPSQAHQPSQKRDCPGHTDHGVSRQEPPPPLLPAPPAPPVPPIPSIFEVLSAHVREAFPNGGLQAADAVSICLQVVEPLLQQACRANAQPDQQRCSMAHAALFTHTAAYPDEAIRLLVAVANGERDVEDVRVVENACNLFVHLVDPYPFNNPTPLPHGAEYHIWNGMMLMFAARTFILYQCQSLAAYEWFGSSAIQFSQLMYWIYLEEVRLQFNIAAQYPAEATRFAEWCLRNASYEIGKACELVGMGAASQNPQQVLLSSYSAQLPTVPPSQNVGRQQQAEGPSVQERNPSSLIDQQVHIEKVPGAHPITSDATMNRVAHVVDEPSQAHQTSQEHDYSDLSVAADQSVDGGVSRQEPQNPNASGSASPLLPLSELPVQAFDLSSSTDHVHLEEAPGAQKVLLGATPDHLVQVEDDPLQAHRTTQDQVPLVLEATPKRLSGLEVLQQALAQVFRQDPSIPIKAFKQTILETYDQMARQLSDSAVTEEPLGPGTVGLKNVGNSCYMSAALQCLIQTPDFHKIFTRKKISSLLKFGSGDKAMRIAAKLAALFDAMWSEMNQVITPANFLKHFVPALILLRQEDASEFLTLLLTDLDNVTDRTEKTRFEQDYEGGEAIVSNAKDYLEKNLKYQSSPVRDELGMVTVSETGCGNCSLSSAVFVEPITLQIALPPEKEECTLMECMRSHFSVEPLDDAKCDKCKLPRTQTTKLWRPPKVLILQLTRFKKVVDSNGKARYDKNCVWVDLDDGALDVTQLLHPKAPREKTNFKLYAATVHMGDREKGHYTAVTCNLKNGNWYEFNDTKVERPEIRGEEVCTLFYKQCSNDEEVGPVAVSPIPMEEEQSVQSKEPSCSRSSFSSCQSDSELHSDSHDKAPALVQLDIQDGADDGMELEALQTALPEESMEHPELTDPSTTPATQSNPGAPVHPVSLPSVVSSLGQGTHQEMESAEPEVQSSPPNHVDQVVGTPAIQPKTEVQDILSSFEADGLPPLVAVILRRNAILVGRTFRLQEDKSIAVHSSREMESVLSICLELFSTMHELATLSTSKAFTKSLEAARQILEVVMEPNTKESADFVLHLLKLSKVFLEASHYPTRAEQLLNRCAGTYKRMVEVEINGNEASTPWSIQEVVSELSKMKGEIEEEDDSKEVVGTLSGLNKWRRMHATELVDKVLYEWYQAKHHTFASNLPPTIFPDWRGWLLDAIRSLQLVLEEIQLPQTIPPLQHIEKRAEETDDKEELKRDVLDHQQTSGETGMSMNFGDCEATDISESDVLADQISSQSSPLQSVPVSPQVQDQADIQEEEVISPEYDYDPDDAFDDVHLGQEDNAPSDLGAHLVLDRPEAVEELDLQVEAADEVNAPPLGQRTPSLPSSLLSPRVAHLAETSDALVFDALKALPVFSRLIYRPLFLLSHAPSPPPAAQISQVAPSAILSLAQGIRAPTTARQGHLGIPATPPLAPQISPVSPTAQVVPALGPIRRGRRARAVAAPAPAPIHRYPLRSRAPPPQPAAQMTQVTLPVVAQQIPKTQGTPVPRVSTRQGRRGGRNGSSPSRQAHSRGNRATPARSNAQVAPTAAARRRNVRRARSPTVRYSSAPLPANWNPRRLRNNQVTRDRTLAILMDQEED